MWARRGWIGGRQVQMMATLDSMEDQAAAGPLRSYNLVSIVANRSGVCNVTGELIATAAGELDDSNKTDDAHCADAGGVSIGLDDGGGAEAERDVQEPQSKH
jgi:hypothetical protein